MRRGKFKRGIILKITLPVHAKTDKDGHELLHTMWLQQKAYQKADENSKMPKMWQRV